MCSVCANWSFTAWISSKCLMILIDMDDGWWDILTFPVDSPELPLQIGRPVYPKAFSFTPFPSSTPPSAQEASRRTLGKWECPSHRQDSQNCQNKEELPWRVWEGRLLPVAFCGGPGSLSTCSASIYSSSPLPHPHSFYFAGGGVHRAIPGANGAAPDI